MAHAAEKWDVLDIWDWDGDARVMLEMKPSCYGTWRCGLRQMGRQGWSRRQGILQCLGCLIPLLSASLLGYFSVTVNQGLTLQLFLIDHFPRTLTYRFFFKHLLSLLLGNCQVWACWVVHYIWSISVTNCRTVFQSACTVLLSHQWWVSRLLCVLTGLCQGFCAFGFSAYFPF